MFQLNNVPSARKCQAQSRHHPRRRRKVCHVRLGTRPWYASRATTRRSGGEESQRAGGEHEGGATARTAKRNDGHTHRAGPPEGRANATARDDTARDDTDVTSVHARTSSTHAPQRRVAGPTRPNRARGLFWCALSRGGASEGRIGAVVVFVWVTSAGAGWVVRRVDRTAVFVCRPKGAARHAWGASGLCASGLLRCWTRLWWCSCG